MKVGFALLASIAATVVSAASGKGFINVPLHKQQKTSAVQKLVKSRPGSAGPRRVDSQDESYIAELSVGTPGQSVLASIDTGSSDTWVFTTASGIEPSFDPSLSSTYQWVNDHFSIAYLSGATSGSYVKDTVAFGDAVVTNLQFGITNTSSNLTVSGFGNSSILGLGYVKGEATFSSDQYPNFPQALVDRGVINRNVYSVFLDDISASSGTLLFGAVDSERYKGQLYQVPFVDDSTLSAKFKLNGTEITGVLDTGTTLAYVPDFTVLPYFSSHGAVVNETYKSLGDLFVFTNTRPAQGLTLDFDGAKIYVPPEEVWVDVSYFFAENDPDTPYPYEYKYVSTFVPDDVNLEENEPTALLGDSFLRSAYLVYDLDRKQLSIGQANWGNPSSNVQVIVGDVPGARPAPGYS